MLPTRGHFAITHDSFSVNQNVGRESVHVEGARYVTISIKILIPDHLVLVDEAAPFRFVTVSTDADHFEKRLFGKPLLQIAQSGNGRHAWPTPGSPKIQQHDFAVQLIRRKVLAPRGRQRKLGSIGFASAARVLD